MALFILLKRKKKGKTFQSGIHSEIVLVSSAHGGVQKQKGCSFNEKDKLSATDNAVDMANNYAL